MTFWDYLALRAVRRSSTERHWITAALFAFIVGLLLMAREDPTLWKDTTFTDLLKLVVTTGFLNMVLSFHFSANKGDETKSENTRAAFEAITETAKQGALAPDVTLKPGETAQADPNPASLP